MKDDPSALAALAGVEADLLANGWKRMRRAPRADWYEFRFRRTVPAPNAAEAPAPARVDAPSVAPVREHDAGPGETIVVPIDATLMGLRAAPNPALSLDGRLRPRVRSGWAL